MFFFTLMSLPFPVSQHLCVDRSGPHSYLNFQGKNRPVARVFLWEGVIQRADWPNEAEGEIRLSETAFRALWTSKLIFLSDPTFCMYSRLSITRTFKGNRKKVQVIGSSKKIAESKVKNSFYGTVNILIRLINCRNVKWKLKDAFRL